MSKGKKKQEQGKATKARQRAEIIMKVRSGLMTATEGATALGISRKSYYKWENRALDAMLDGLEDKETGRPETPGSLQNEIDLRKEIEKLQQENKFLEQKCELSKLVHQFKLDRVKEQVKRKHSKPAKKKKKKTGRS